MNNVSIIGRITKDIELRYTESQIPIVSMFVAIGNGKDKDGNDRPADFPKVYVYEKQAENISKYCHKGSLIGVSGRIKTRSWDKEDGTKGYETYIVARQVQFLESKKEDFPLPEPDYAPTKEDDGTSFDGEVELSEDDYPF